MNKPMQLDLIDRSPGKFPDNTQPPDLPESSYLIIHSCGYEVGYVKSLAYPPDDSRSGFEPVADSMSDRKRAVRCPHCEAFIRGGIDCQFIRKAKP